MEGYESRLARGRQRHEWPSKERWTCG